MRRLTFVLAVAAATIIVPARSRSAEPPQPVLKCDIGPVAKTYGKTQWLVYSCDDNRTVVIISASGNPATPFYFTFYPTGTGYRLGGEGTGRKEATSAAFNELKTLSAKDLAALIQQTKQAPKAQ